MKILILIAIAASLLACSTSDADLPGNIVHLSGYLSHYVDSAGAYRTVGSYWKNGEYTALTSVETPSRVNSMCVDGSSVLLGGWKWFAGAPSSASQVVVWHNTEESVIAGAWGSPILVAAGNNNVFGVWHEGPSGWVWNKNGISQAFADTAANIDPSSLAVAEGDVYIAGSAAYEYGTGPVIHELRAQCWKNGELIFRETLNSNALSIFIHGNNIYLAGHHYVNGLPESTACYWKNGQRVDLTDGTSTAIAKSVFVTDEHVYVAGMINHQAVYWVDGNPFFLSEANSMAHALVVHGSDVHVGGHIDAHPAYWKNGVRQTIRNQEEFGEIDFVAVRGN